MDLRVFTEPQQGATYDDLLRVARATEELGFDAFFRSDHYLAMGVDGRPGPTDAWASLAGLARETSWIRLGTLVSSGTFRLPGPLAITVAQVDAMSGGRVELGLGAGWYEAEHLAYGIPFPPVAERFDRLEEQLEVITGLWATPEGKTYDHVGTHYPVKDSPALPKPVQSPRPPIILGGAARKRGAALAARYADEFNVAFKSDEETAGAFDRIRTASAGTGRDVVLSVAKTVCVGRDDAELRKRADTIGFDVDELRLVHVAGTPAEVVERVEALRAAGSTRLYLQLLDMSDIDQLELIAAEVLPHV
jgi:alkanesulfonate monooxygenase